MNGDIMFAIKPNTQVNTNRPATNETPQTHDKHRHVQRA